MANITYRDRNKSKGGRPNWEWRFDMAPIDGKRQQKSKSGYRTKAECIKAATEAFSAYNNAGHVIAPSEMSVADYMNWWYDNYCLNNCADSTCDAYSRIMRLHIIPEIGFYKMSSIITVTLQEYINKIYARGGYSRGYLKNIYKVLRGSFSYAANVARIIDNDPAEHVKLPKNGNNSIENKVKVLSAEQVDTIFKRFEDKRYLYMSMKVAYYTGCRVGEVYALRWQDVDFENKTITVSGCIKKVDGHWCLGDCKTTSSYRTIKVSLSLIDDLARFKREQAENRLKCGADYMLQYIEDYTSHAHRSLKMVLPVQVRNAVDKVYTDLIFCKPDGNFRGTDSVKYLTRIINYDLGIPFNFHMFRHTHATLLIEADVPIKAISTRLGHGSVRTTIDTYCHTTDNMEQMAVDKFDNIVDNMWSKAK